MRKQTFLSICVLALSTLYPAISNSCFAPPEEASSRPLNLVLGANYIVLAEAKERLSGDGGLPTEFLFETKEVLKGEAPNLFKFHGFSRSENLGASEDFDAHTDPQFWAYSHGNSTITTWCGVFGIFEIGQTYLIINSDSGHFKGYENIRTDDDLWLKVIRVLVGDWSNDLPGGFRTER